MEISLLGMPNELGNNQKLMDYGRFFEEKRERPQEEEPATPEDEVETVKGFAGFWSGADKKTKIELFVFALVLGVTIVSLVFYFINRKPSFNPEESYSPPAVENWQVE